MGLRGRPFLPRSAAIVFATGNAKAFSRSSGRDPTKDRKCCCELPLGLFDSKLIEDGNECSLGKRLVAMKWNDRVFPVGGIDPATVTSDTMTTDATLSFDPSLCLACRHRLHENTFSRTGGRLVDVRRVVRRFASFAVRSQHVIASRRLCLSSSGVSATVKHPGMAGISAQYVPFSR